VSQCVQTETAPQILAPVYNANATVPIPVYNVTSPSAGGAVIELPAGEAVCYVIDPFRLEKPVCMIVAVCASCL
jgi:hypothetical protein